MPDIKFGVIVEIAGYTCVIAEDSTGERYRSTLTRLSTLEFAEGEVRFAGRATRIHRALRAGEQVAFQPTRGTYQIEHMTRRSTFIEFGRKAAKDLQNTPAETSRKMRDLRVTLMVNHELVGSVVISEGESTLGVIARAYEEGLIEGQLIDRIHWKLRVRGSNAGDAVHDGDTVDFYE